MKKSNYPISTHFSGNLPIFLLILVFVSVGCSGLFEKISSISSKSASDPVVENDRPNTELNSNPANLDTNSPCYNKFYPLMPNTARQYGVFTGMTADSQNYSNPPTTYIKTQTLKGGDSFTETMKFSNGLEVSITWECTAEGLRNDQLWGTLKSSNTSQDVELISRSGVVMPNDEWKPGKKWVYEVKIKLTDKGEKGSEGILSTAKIEYEVISVNDKIVVPAGEFTAARVDATASMEVFIPGKGNVPVTLKNSEWYAPEAGLVKLTQTGFNTATNVYLGEK